MLKNFLFRLRLIFIPCQGNKYRPRFLSGNFLLYYAVFLLILKLFIIPLFFYFPKTVFFADITKTNLIELTNVARRHLGLVELKESPFLSQAAYLKAKDMAEKGYFDHYSPEGVSPWYWLKRSGYSYVMAGENLAIGFLESEQVHQAWMNSFSHKKNILNPSYQEIGIAVLRENFQGKETTLVVQYFGTREKVFFREKPLELLVAEKEEKTEPKEEKQPERLVFTPEEKEAVIAEEAEEKEKATEEKELFQEEPFVLEAEEAVAAVFEDNFKKSPAFALAKFMAGSYYDLIQKIIYASLILIIASLFATVYCDIFVYGKFEIQYKDAIFKTIGFSALWLFLVFLDKLMLIGIFAQNFRIN